LTGEGTNGASVGQPQRLTIVTPTTAEFHSGTYRIASSAVARGHEVTVEAPWSLGRVSAVQLEAGQIRAAANPRAMQGYAIAR